MPLLMICEILGVFVNILTAAGKYPLQACQNLLLQIQMHLSKKRKSFSNSLFHFWNFHQILNILKKKNDGHNLCVSEIKDCQRRD